MCCEIPCHIFQRKWEWRLKCSFKVCSDRTKANSKRKYYVMCAVCSLIFFVCCSLFLFGVNGPEPGAGSRIPRRRERQPTILPKFSKKLHAIPKILDREGGRRGGGGALLRSATVNTYRQRHLNKRHSIHKVFFTRSVNITVSVSGIFDLFNVTCKQCHRSTLNPFLKVCEKW